MSRDEDFFLGVVQTNCHPVVTEEVHVSLIKSKVNILTLLSNGHPGECIIIEKEENSFVELNIYSTRFTPNHYLSLFLILTSTI